MTLPIAAWIFLPRRRKRALTTLMIPVVGVLGAMMLVGDRPGPLDLAGFAAVLGAAALILLPGRAPAAQTIPPGVQGGTK